ncbi:hypothetical protein OU997_20755 [Pseudomonas sp. SL4(2022)]|uniref:hypothetical protein n=1 Tax=Pseudomonas sp. SL4(2022) TaxID=2994661 RepID=UPI00226DA521|nr:hypothetical protein [Pseudomonas sp. SL4(2022)]WAC44619.1 hypothetical protein OU997_20755 [Pseudomonas sp. SL4(2022)]
MQKSTIDTQLFLKIPIHCEQSGSTGNVIFKDIQAQPLKLGDWFAFSDSNELKIKIFGTVAKKPEWAIEYPPVGNGFKADFTVDPDLKNSCFALVKGGWLPLIYTFSNSNIIADRNIVSEIKARFSKGAISPPNRDRDDFIDYMNDKNCSCTIHTISYALESNQRKLPSVATMKEQHRAALKTISNALPHIKTWPKSDSDLQYLTDLMDQLRGYFNEGVRLLTKVAPLLVNSPSRRMRVERWRKMAETAEAENISKNHVAFIACLSASAADQSFNPAQKLIKPKINYTVEDAYNSMYDLFLVMLSNLLQTQSPERKVSLVTRDKNLALFWMGLTFADPSNSGQQMIGLHEKFLPVSQEEMEELAKILGEERITQTWCLPRSTKF